MYGKSTRRSTLKRLGIGAVGMAGLSSMAAGASGENKGEAVRSEKLITAARKVGNKRGLAARQQFLIRAGVPTATETKVYQLPGEDDNGFSTNKVRCVEPDKCSGDIELGLSISYFSSSDEYYVENMARIRYDGVINQYGYLEIHDGGSDPVDALGIQWDQDHWQLRDRSHIPNSINTDTHTEWDNGSWNQEGLAFRVDDYTMCKDGGETDGFEWTPYDYTGVYLVKGPSHQSGDLVTASYEHIWSGSDLSFGVSFPYGITIASSSSVSSENLQTDLKGDSLAVTAADASDNLQS